MSLLKSVVVSFFLVSVAAQANPNLREDSKGVQKGFVKIYDNHELYVEYKEAKPGHPTIVLLNGMTYSTNDWNEFVAQFTENNPDAGVLAYDMYGQGKTLLKYAGRLIFSPYNTPEGRIAYKQQASDLRLLLKRLEIEDQIHLVGLSYGGAIAQQFLNDYGSEFEQELGSIVLMAPFMSPLRGQVEIIENWIQWTRIMQPWNSWSDEALYDFFLRQLVYSTYPAAEPSILENPYKLEATYRLAQGMKNFNGYKYARNFSGRKVHMMIPTEDEYLEQEAFSEYWDTMDEDGRASRLIVEGGRHKLPEELPTLSSEWVSRLIYDEDGRYKRGETFYSSKLSHSYSSDVAADVAKTNCKLALERDIL